MKRPMALNKHKHTICIHSWK